MNLSPNRFSLAGTLCLIMACNPAGSKYEEAIELAEAKKFKESIDTFNEVITGWPDIHPTTLQFTWACVVRLCGGRGEILPLPLSYPSHGLTAASILPPDEPRDPLNTAEAFE